MSPIHQIIRLNDDEVFARDAGILEGMEFSATFHVTTPLSVLSHHGEIFHGPPSHAPAYGTQAQGIWLYKTKSWKSLTGSDLEEFKSETRAADVGPVVPSEYLPFLIEFRTIFETEGPHEEILSCLQQLSHQSNKFAEFWRKLQESYDDFPRSLFYRPFAQLDGVGCVTARNLYVAGFRSIAQIMASQLPDLVAVPGVGVATARKILASRIDASALTAK